MEGKEAAKTSKFDSRAEFRNISVWVYSNRSRQGRINYYRGLTTDIAQGGRYAAASNSEFRFDLTKFLLITNSSFL